MGIFYTGKGDRGTSIICKKKIPKTALAIETLGQLDALNSLIGVVRNQPLPKSFKKNLYRVQENLPGQKNN